MFFRKKNKKARQIILPGFRCAIKSWKSVRINRHFLAVTAHSLKLYDAFNQGKQGVVLAAAYIIAGMDLCATLAIKDVTSLYCLATKFLAAKALSA